MADGYVKPLTSMGLKDFDRLGERLKNPSQELVHALIERVQEFLTGFSGDRSNEDSIYEITSELTAAGAWKVIPPADALHFLELANSATQEFFIKHLPRDYQEALLRETQHAHLMASGARRDAYKAVVRSVSSPVRHTVSSKSRSSSLSRALINPGAGILGALYSASLDNLLVDEPSGFSGGDEPMLSSWFAKVGVSLDYQLLHENHLRHRIHVATESTNTPRAMGVTLVESAREELNLFIIANTLLRVLSSGDGIDGSPERKGKQGNHPRVAKTTLL